MIGIAKTFYEDHVILNLSTRVTCIFNKNRKEKRRVKIYLALPHRRCFSNFLCDLWEKWKSTEKRARGPRREDEDTFFRTAWLSPGLSLRIEKRRAKSRSLRSGSSETKATRKEGRGALSLSLRRLPTAPVDSRNIFARLTEPLGRRLLVRPINVWARLLSDLLLAPAFVFFRSGVRRPRLTLPEREGRADPSPIGRYPIREA